MGREVSLYRIILVFDKAVIEPGEEGVDNVLLFGADQPSIELHGIAEDHCRYTKMQPPVNHVVPSHARWRRLQDKQNHCMGGNNVTVI